MLFFCLDRLGDEEFTEAVGQGTWVPGPWWWSGWADTCWDIPNPRGLTLVTLAERHLSHSQLQGLSAVRALRMVSMTLGGYVANPLWMLSHMKAWGSLGFLGSACPFTMGREDPGVLLLPRGSSRTGTRLPLFLNPPCCIAPILVPMPLTWHGSSCLSSECIQGPESSAA